MKKFIFNIASVIEAPIGSNENYSFEITPAFKDIALDGQISGKIQIMRIEGGVNVLAENIHVKAKVLCDKCLKKISVPMEIKSAERQFYFETPSESRDAYDIFFIDKKSLSIDIGEMLRQEIILHFPVNSVCSSRCLGLCPYCGKNRNSVVCKCEEKESLPKNIENKPLAVLKKLIK
ncbi:DUF177 domain-containing protein [Candidatus Peregrinibacteria bacterium]|nr:DUF177 domain-containing protein [Candidatus Peregrinibacteria bacterium]